jgi:hypothetical protein
MQKKVLAFFLSTLLLGALMVSAANTPTAIAAPDVPKPVKLNTACQPLKMKSQNKNLILDGSNATNGQIFLLRNQSQKSVWLDHPGKHTSASAGWSSYLRPGEWSALLLDKKDFSLSCSSIQPGKVETLDCAQALSVCIPLHFSFTTSKKGSFWLVEGKSPKDLLKALELHGVAFSKVNPSKTEAKKIAK